MSLRRGREGRRESLDLPFPVWNRGEEPAGVPLAWEGKEEPQRGGGGRIAGGWNMGASICLLHVAFVPFIGGREGVIPVG